ncbi:glycosyltransferase family 39 protein [Methanobrevibacter thaueri]|nr:glycosyltransferase family 39 protein [Methanobrevibacter thaueri]
MIEMNVSSFFNKINLYDEDKYYLLILFVISLLITVMLIRFHLTRGAFSSDLYVYLAAALDFADLNVNNISNPSFLANSPVVCYLTSILFRLGFVDIRSIFIVTGLFGILGILGMYVLLKIRFSPLLSFTGALLYSSFSLTLLYFACGLLDVPAVSMIIWTLIFTFAIDNDNRFYALAGISAVLSFFTRYTNAYIIILIALYVLKNHDVIELVKDMIYDRRLFIKKSSDFFRSNEFKWICISGIISLTCLLYVFHVLLSMGSSLSYFGAASGSLNHFSSNSYQFGHLPDKFFYIKNYLNFLYCDKIIFENLGPNFINHSPVVYLIILILISGFLLKVKKSSNAIKCFVGKIFEHKFFCLLIFVLCCFAIIGLKTNYLITLFSIWVICLILMHLAKRYCGNIDNFTVSLICFCLFTFYLIVFSLMDIKTERYILPTFPALVYFVIYSLNQVFNFIGNNFDSPTFNKDKSEDNSYFLSRFLTIIFIILLLFMIFNFPSTVEYDDMALQIDSVANYLINYDENFMDKEIGSSGGLRFYEWYFKNEVDLVNIPGSHADRLVGIGFELKEFNQTKYDYIITTAKWQHENYTKIYHEGATSLYERNF